MPDRIGRLLGNVFTLDQPGVKLAAPTNGNGKHAAPAAEQKGVVFAPGFVPINAAGGTVPVRLSTERAMLASVLCFAAITYRMQKISEAPLMVVDETDEGEPWLSDHPLAELLQAPNPDQEMADLIEETQVALDLLGGMALWVKDYDRSNEPARLRAFNATEFSVHPANGRVYGRFRVRTSKGLQDHDPEDVVFFRYPHPTDRWAGLCPTDVALSRLGLEAELIDSLKAGLRNSVVPGMTLAFPSDASPSNEQRQEFKADLQSGYEQARNHGKSLVIGGGVTATQNKLGFQGLAGGELWREVEAAVCLAYGIRPEILGAMVGLENSPWSHMQTAHRLVYDTTIIPLWRRWERTLTRQLLRPVDEDASRLIRFDTSKVRALQDDQLEQARRAVLLRAVATRNQRRQIAGLEPMEEDPEFWDAVEERTATGGLGLPGEAGAKARAPAERKEIDDRAVRWAVFDALATKDEAGWESSAWAQMNDDRKAIVGIIESAKAAAAPAERKEPPPYGPADAELVRRLVKQIEEHMDLEAAVAWRARAEPLTEEAARRAIERAAAEFGISFDLLQPGIAEFVESHAAQLVTQVTETTKQAIREALSAGLLEGESIPDLVKRIQDSGAFARSRATLIARTETTAVFNGAQRAGLSAYQAESGAKVLKQWLSARDGRVRPEHAELDGQSRAIDEAFSNGRLQPGEPNCRCTLTYQVEAAA